MQEAKPAEAIFTVEETGEEKECMVLNSNVLICGRRYMTIRIGEEEKTVLAKNVKIL